MKEKLEKLSHLMIQLFMRLWLISLYQDIKKECEEQQAQKIKKDLHIKQVKKEIVKLFSNLRVLNSVKK